MKKLLLLLLISFGLIGSANDYVDWTLHTQWNQELSEFLKNKLEDEASDYDI